MNVNRLHKEKPATSNDLKQIIQRLPLNKAPGQDEVQNIVRINYRKKSGTFKIILWILVLQTLVEWIIYRRMKTHGSKNGLLTDDQWGLKEWRSMQIQVTRLTDHVSNNFIMIKSIWLVLLEFDMTSDTVW